MTSASTALASLRDLKGSYVLDPEHSRIGFVARHAMVTKVRGSFLEFEGTAVFTEDLSQSSAAVYIQASSIDTRNAERDEHLRSSDFLAVHDYPEIRFMSVNVRPVGIAQLAVEGDLTVRGVTKRVAIDFSYAGMVTDPWGDVRIGFEGSTVISRKDFGVTFNAALETGGVLVGDKVTLEFEVSAIKDS